MSETERRMIEMTSTIETVLVWENGRVGLGMKEYPNYCGIEDIGFIYRGMYDDPKLEYNGKIYNVHDASDAMWSDFVEEFPEKDGDYEAFAQYVYEHRDEVYELLEC